MNTKEEYFLQSVPIDYNGSLDTRPVEDYIALPANVASSSGLSSKIIVVEEFDFPKHAKKKNNLKNAEIEYLSLKNFLFFLIRERNKFIFYANSRVVSSFLGVVFSKKSILISHDCEPPSSFLKRIFFKFFINKFSFHRINTPYEARVLKKLGVRTSKLKLIPLVVDVAFYSKKVNFKKETIIKKYGLPLNKKYVLFLANLRSHKSPVIILKALKNLPEDVVFVHLGADLLKHENLESAREMAKKFDVSNRFFELGKLDPKQIREIFSIGDVYVHPTFREGQCLAVYEAAAAGLPLCLSSIGSFTSVFEGAALFHEVQDERQLAKNILLYLNHPKIYKDQKLKLSKILKRVEYTAVNKQMKELFINLSRRVK